MDIFSFFKTGQKQTKTSLSAQFKKIQERRQGLKNESSEIMRGVLNGSIEGSSAKLNSIRDEEAFLDVAEKEIERLMSELFTAELQKKHDEYPAQREVYQARFDLVQGQAGELLGRAITLLQSLRAAEAMPGMLSDGICECFEKITGREAYEKQSQSLVDGFARAKSEQLEVEDFGAWRKRLEEAARLEPGSVAANAYINKHMKVLLYRPAEKTAPAQPIGWMRGRID